MISTPDLKGPIRNKRHMYQLLRLGMLGNPPLTFSTVKDAVSWASEYPGRDLSIRSTVPRSPLFRAHMAPMAFVALYEHYKATGVDLGTLIFSESPPRRTMLVQGEVAEIETVSDVGLQFEYTYDSLNMREAFTFDRHFARGLQARELLRAHMDENSQNCLWDLLAKYPGHVLEISVYDRPVGRYRWNTMFWEVRRY